MKIVLRTLAVLALACSSVFADAVPVANHSFEEPAMPLESGATWTNDLPGWNGPANAGDSFIELIGGFAADGQGHLGMAANAEVSQDLGVALSPNTMYTLSVAVGRRNASFTVEGNESRFGLYAGGDAEDGGALLVDGTYDAFPLQDSEFVDQSVSFTTGEAVPAGNLFVSLRSTGANRAHWDNIRVDATLVPEPSSLALVAFGFLGLLARRRK
ncbi:MAG: PEP-CTERM sorting domain-containing protein [Planctomycetales bacterium]|nr:PEP-CTERM sorting domain-containing protein [Planctomycetales bacterium]